MGKRTAIIFNPISGRGKARELGSEVARALRTKGHEVLLCPTEAAGDASRIAGDFEKNEIEAFVAVGGDGTVSEIACGLKGNNVPIAICPAGTANVLAHELGLPGTPNKIAELITKWKIKRIDTGIFGKKRFIIALSAGIDAWIVRDLHNARKGAITMATYTTPILRAMKSYRHPPITVEIDGKLIGNGFGYVVIGNTHRYGGPLRIARRGRIDDGLFDITVARGRNMKTSIKYTAASLARALPLLSGVKTYKGKKVALKPGSESEVPVQVDGDPCGYLPVNVEIIHHALPVLVP